MNDYKKGVSPLGITILAIKYADAYFRWSTSDIDSQEVAVFKRIMDAEREHLKNALTSSGN